MQRKTRSIAWAERLSVKPPAMPSPGILPIVDLLSPATKIYGINDTRYRTYYYYFRSSFFPKLFKARPGPHKVHLSELFQHYVGWLTGWVLFLLLNIQCQHTEADLCTGLNYSPWLIRISARPFKQLNFLVHPSQARCPAEILRLVRPFR